MRQAHPIQPETLDDYIASELRRPDVWGAGLLLAGIAITLLILVLLMGGTPR